MIRSAFIIFNIQDQFVKGIKVTKYSLNSQKLFNAEPIELGFKYLAIIESISLKGFTYRSWTHEANAVRLLK